MSFGALFPVPFLSGFTTSSTITHPNITHFPLRDDTLGVHKVTKTIIGHRIVIHNGEEAWEALYPEGSLNPTAKIKGGFGFYLHGPHSDGTAWEERLKKANEVTFSYCVSFEKGFQWVKGGKLPGIYGGVGDAVYKCTGGRANEEERCHCFNLRLMWRDNGKGELYTYLPRHPSNTERLLAVPPWSKQNPDFGFSVGRGAFAFSNNNERTAVAERVKLNDPGVENGEIEVFVNGQSVIKATGLVLRSEETSHCHGLHFQTFFGGHTPDWASPCDQRAWFSDVSGAIIA